jgi:SEC-C motif-containing protein
VIKGEQKAGTAEQLIRSRYSAYARGEIDYLYTSLHPDKRADFDEKSTRDWAERSQWHGLEIVETYRGAEKDTEGRIEFTASFTDDGIRREHRELASFSKVEGTWYFVKGEVAPVRQFVRPGPKTGRNDPCPCGSGKKFKKCCGRA